MVGDCLAGMAAAEKGKFAIGKALAGCGSVPLARRQIGRIL